MPLTKCLQKITQFDTLPYERSGVYKVVNKNISERKRVRRSGTKIEYLQIFMLVNLSEVHIDSMSTALKLNSDKCKNFRSIRAS